MNKFAMGLAAFGLFMVILLWGPAIVAFITSIAQMFGGPVPLPAQPVPAP